MNYPERRKIHPLLLLLAPLLTNYELKHTVLKNQPFAMSQWVWILLQYHPHLRDDAINNCQCLFVLPSQTCGSFSKTKAKTCTFLCRRLQTAAVFWRSREAFVLFWSWPLRFWVCREKITTALCLRAGPQMAAKFVHPCLKNGQLGMYTVYRYFFAPVPN